MNQNGVNVRYLVGNQSVARRIWLKMVQRAQTQFYSHRIHVRTWIHQKKFDQFGHHTTHLLIYYFHYKIQMNAHVPFGAIACRLPEKQVQSKYHVDVVAAWRHIAQ